MKEEKLKKGEMAAIKSAISIIILSLVEALIGILSGAMILISDALHNVTDSLSLFASTLGLRISRRKPTERFPYGYYKAENLAALIVSAFIIYAAIELCIEGYSRLLGLPEMKMEIEALSISIVSAIFSFFLAKYMQKIGREINSQALIANSKERFTHVFSSMVIFLVILLSYFKIPYVEGIAIIAFSILILKEGFISLKDSIFSLMDVAPSKELIEEVKKTVESIKGVEEIKEMRLRRAGPFVFGEIEIKVGKGINVEKAHGIANEIENKIKKKFEEIISITVHVEPYEKEEVKVAIPITVDKGLNSPLMEHFGRAENFIFVYVDKKNKRIKDFYVKPNPFKTQTIKAGLSVSKFLIKERIDAVITKEIGEISFHTLKSNLVEIFKAEGKNVKEVLNKYMEGKLLKLKEATKPEEERISTKFQRFWGRWRRRGPWWRRVYISKFVFQIKHRWCSKWY